MLTPPPFIFLSFYGWPPSFYEYLFYVWLRRRRKRVLIFGLLGNYISKNFLIVSCFDFELFKLWFWSVEIKGDQQFYIQMLLNQLMHLMTQVLPAFKKWEVKVTHPTPLCLCMHGLLMIRAALTKLEWITWLYRLCWLQYFLFFKPCDNSALLCRSVLIISAQVWMNLHVVISHFVFFSNFLKILRGCGRYLSVLINHRNLY